MNDFVENWFKKHKRGTLITPAVECPICRKKTRADYKCQRCKTEWDKEQLKVRDKQKAEIILSKSNDVSLDAETRNYLKSYAKQLIKNV